MASAQADVVQTECAVAPPMLSASSVPPAGAATASGKALQSITRQASIYSLTLDEFQNALGEPAKNFGSMNMDEFLKNIWTVEESQAMAAAMGAAPSDEPNPVWYPGVPRQVSISLPRTLSKITVDDVWKDIARGSIDMDSHPISAASGHERQVTLGEMTLEDFLVKAGAVKKEESTNQSLVPFGMSFESSFGSGAVNKIGDRFGFGNDFFCVTGAEGEKPGVTVMPTLSLSGANILSNETGLEAMQAEVLDHVSPIPQQSDWLPKSDLTFRHQQPNILDPHTVEANGRKGVGNDTLMGTSLGGLGVGGLVGGDMGVGYGTAGMPPCGANPPPLTLKIGSPQSPMLDGFSPSHESMSLHSPLPYGFEGVARGRKRDFEGSLEKVVERRQKRMIKNRESAARSRARKQAYTVELEAEVSHLKEENLRLRRQEEEIAVRRRNQLIDMLTSCGPRFAPKACRLRRTHTGPW